MNPSLLGPAGKSKGTHLVTIGFGVHPVVQGVESNVEKWDEEILVGSWGRGASLADEKVEVPLDFDGYGLLLPQHVNG